MEEAESENGRLTLDEDLRTRLHRCLSRHPVSFAVVFGSLAREEATTESDLDLAVAFESHKPSEEGYSDTYLRLRSDLNDSLPVDVDLVDVRSMSPSFARIVFDSGILVFGSEEKRDELEREVAGERPSVAEAKERVAAAARRLRDDRSDVEEITE